MATKVTKTATENEIATPTPSIPLARIPAEDSKPDSKLSAKDRMKGLSVAPKVPKAAAATRPTYDAPKEAVDALRRFIPAKAIWSIAEKRASNAESEASEILFKSFCEALWKSKVVPANPKVLIKDEKDQPEMSAIFQVQDKFSPGNMKLPEIKVEMEEEKIVSLIVNALVEAGAEKADAEKLVLDEIETSKRRNIRSLNDLAIGHYEQDKRWVEATPEEQVVAGKMMDWLDTLTPEEQALVRRDEIKVTVKKDFLTRVCNYAHGVEQLRGILQIFGPTNFVSHAALGLSDDEATRIKKLQQAADEMIGSVQAK